ncbi:uncharacterized protein LY89DRAFT_729966 [Mollisia scopiformis]|uniref:Uncharacterized protein n=1 Tax=Mollisia scopiformis TaxID=149040 RepID=A0A194XLW6_MOLSC|nr:uncharacterized protein LY89DRAFT_729966 [Mollisia scopiformis]KUJ21173.1 hypothetical protein LY89DRAFT_729966 [Mollisia scopiformis]
MKYQQPSSTAARTPYYDTDTTQTSRTDPPRRQNGVPPGTVAARVQFLQGLQTPGTARPGPAPAPAATSSNRRRENSRTGFGRRLTNRFGPPALQSAQPFEEARVDTSHSFLGLNTPRKSHVEEHGLADNRARYSKSPGINGTIAQVTRERAQFDAVAPWVGLSRSKSSRSMGRKNEGNDMDGHRSDRVAYHGHIVAEATIFPLPTHEDDPSKFRREMKARETDTLKSESSLATSSTIRRQSVRDLFEDYGIERPEGLASSNESSRDIEDLPRPTRPHRFCHMCAWVNSGPSVKCWRCSHRLCSICDAQSPQPVTRKEPSLGYSERFTKSKGLENQPSLVSSSKYNRDIETEPVKPISSRPGPSPIQRRVEENTLQPQKGSSPPTKFPDFHPNLPPATKPSHASHPPKTAARNAVPSGGQVTTSVKDSPFLIADSTAKKQSITLFPFDHREDRHQSLKDRHEHHLLQQVQRRIHSSSSSSGSSICERGDCRGMNCEHRSHRHVILRTKENEKQYIREETENGYVADTSRVEDEIHEHSHASQSSHTHSTFSRPQSHTLQKAHHSHQHLQETTQESCVPEFVECHGYPRTGHIRHGSCSGAELVGECQHCVEDCQCAACQNTHHNVRCCTHKDHKAIVHQHHTPRKEFPSPDPHVRPLSAPRRPSVPSSSVTVIPQRPQSAKIEPLTIRSSLQNSQPKQVLSTRPSLEKVPSFPLRKKSTFIKEASKPPTPPPWVSQPRSSLLKPLQYDPDDIPNEIVPDPFAPFRKSLTPPVVNTWGESSQNLGNDQGKRLWSTNQLGTMSQARDERPESYRNPLRKISAVKEKRSVSSKGTTRSSSRIKVSPPGSRRASRRLSALFQLREQDSVPALTQKLLRHQDELREGRNNHQEVVKAAPSGGVASIARHLEHREPIKQETKKPGPTKQESRMASRAASTDSTKKWRLRLVDKRPSPTCGNDNKRVVSEHRLADDRVGSSNFKARDRKVMSEARMDLHKNSFDEHECTWKRMVLDVRDGKNGLCSHKETASLGIMGVTIILHLEGKEDMVLKAGSWSTTGEPGSLR